MEKFTKKDLAEKLVENFDQTKKTANEMVNMLFDVMSSELQNGSTIDVAGFGKFVVKTRNARTGVNPATGEKVEIAASKVPAFRAAKALKEAVK